MAKKLKEISASEEFAQAVAHYRKRSREEGELEIEKKSAPDADVQALIDQAQTFAQQSGIGEATILVEESVLACNSGPAGMTDIRTKSEFQNNQVAFEWAGKSWLLSIVGNEDKPDGDGLAGTIQIEFGGETVFQQSVLYRTVGGKDQWHPTSVETLRLGDGDWVQGLIEMAVAIDESQGEDAAVVDAEARKKWAARIDLGNKPQKAKAPAKRAAQPKAEPEEQPEEPSEDLPEEQEKAKPKARPKARPAARKGGSLDKTLRRLIADKSIGEETKAELHDFLEQHQAGTLDKDDEDYIVAFDARLTRGRES